MNTDAFNGTRDLEGYGRASVANFAAHRMDTKVEGVVVNDRDADFNTLDPGEALAAVTITLIDDANADGLVTAGEVTVGTTTTDATGAYAFSGLQEDNYIVSALSPGERHGAASAVCDGAGYQYGDGAHDSGYRCWRHAEPEWDQPGW